MKKILYILAFASITLTAWTLEEDSSTASSSDFGQMPTTVSNVIHTDAMDPSIIMSLGWASYERGELGSALQYAQQVQQRMGHYSEASYLIGLVYLKDGLFVLSERALKEALTYATSSEESADYALALANLYYMMEEFSAMRQQLEDVIFGLPTSNEALAVRQTLAGQMQQARLLLKKDGLDRVIQLYRWGGLHHDVAVELLGLYAYNQDTYLGYEEAVELFTYSTVIKVGNLITYLMDIDPSYRFTNLHELLQYAQEYPAMQRYIDSSELYRTLFLLASSLYAYEKLDVSKIIWNGVRLQPSSSIWVRRSEVRFRDPKIENLSQEFNTIFNQLHR